MNGNESVYHLDASRGPWTVQIEARVGGSLDEVRFREAVAAALASHPMARARRPRLHGSVLAAKILGKVGDPARLH